MKERKKRPGKKEELPVEKKIMEVILNILIIATMTYFFLLIVVL